MPAPLRSLAFAALLVASLAPAAGALDWAVLADVDEVEVVTRDEDGETRVTTIWLVVVDGHGYIRTRRGSTWGGNVQRDPAIGLRVDGADHPVRATVVEDAPIRERVVAAFREKYGWFDGFIDVFRGSNPLIMRLDARA